MFRKLKILIIVTGFLTGCMNSSKPEGQENEISQSVVDNPVTASAHKNSKDNIPVFKFDFETHDFGKITAGEVVSFAFSFKNIGKGDLVIRAAQGSCGCTVPEFPKGAIKPGDSGIINVTFNSE